ncbi:myocilin [Esox lucius]|uniref:Myocilin n=1 Tax=Esox lucius TaxID=8010 RepID=A0A3P9AQ26_ESOLU|nr:myocilin [Esox lucius]
MWLDLALCLSCLVLSAHGQDRAPLPHSSNHTGKCLYTFMVDNPAQASCPGATGDPEMEGVKSRLTLLEALVNRLLGDKGAGGEGARPGGDKTTQAACFQAMGEKSQLQEDKKQLNRKVQELQKRVDKLSLEAETLKQRPCHQPQAAGVGLQLHEFNQRAASNPSVTAYQEMKAEVTEIPASRLIQEAGQNNKGCGELVSLGEPVLHRKADSINGKYGVWLQDPEAVGGTYSNRTVWRIDTVGNDVRQLFAYEDMEQFAKGFPMKVLVLPEAVESTGATLYRGSLYYQRRRSRTLLRYDLTSESVAARLELPHAGFHGQHPYSWGGYTDVDLAVDEQGLWAIYSTSKAKGAIVVSRLDPESMEVKRSWETKIRKNTVANAFMICGRLYTVASYTAPDTTINHMFDTAIGKGRAMAVPFKNRYRYNSMVDYNPAERKLYAWDNFHMITYDVRLGSPSSTSQ